MRVVNSRGDLPPEMAAEYERRWVWMQVWASVNTGRQGRCGRSLNTGKAASTGVGECGCR